MVDRLTPVCETCGSEMPNIRGYAATYWATRRFCSRACQHPSLAGQTFGEFTVIAEAPRQSGRRGAYCICQCSCGRVATVRRSALVQGRSRRCRRHPVTDVPGYVGAHSRVYRERGPASAHPCAVCASSRATQWAYDHSDPNELVGEARSRGKKIRVAYSAAPQHYVPMCRPCHARFDNAQEKS